MSGKFTNFISPSRMWKIYFLKAPLILISLISYSAKAQEKDYLDLSPEQLFNATVMSATKTDETWWNTPAAVYVLNNDDISRSGATSIPEALRMVPGVQVSRFHTSGWAVSVRGFNSDLSNKLLVLIDGREVYNHLFSGVYWDSQDVMLEDVERIEVIRGPGAALWGANAVNGVINIITKTAADTQGGLVSGIVGSKERIASTRYGGALGDSGHYRVYGKALYREPQQNLAGNNRANHDWDAWRGGFRADWQGNHKKDNFTLQGDGYESDTRQHRNAATFTPPYLSLNDETNNARGANLLGRWKHILDNNAKLSMQGYVDYSMRDIHLLQDETTAIDLDTQLEFPVWGRHEFLSGLRFRYSINELDGSPQTNFRNAHARDTLYSGFVQDKITLLPDEWFLTLGSKFEHNDYSGFEFQPNGRLQWHPNNRQMVWGSIARAVRTPSRLEQDFDILLAAGPPSATLPVPVGVLLEANPGFDSEELTAYELGYRHQLTPHIQLDLSTFYNDYDQLATNRILTPRLVNNGIDPLHFIIPIEIANMTSGNTYGVETTVSWQATSALDFSASYSYLEMELNGPPSSVAIDSEVAEGHSPQHQFNTRALWDIRPDMQLDSTLYYVGSLAALDVDDYWRFDLRWNWFIDERLEFTLVGQNLLEDAHQEFFVSNGNTTAIERSFYGKLTWRF